MARVPTYDSPQVGNNQSPTSPFNTLLSVEAGALPGKQEAALGQAITEAGSDMGRIVYDAQMQANQVRTIDATNQAKQAMMTLMHDPNQGFLAVKGANVMNRESGKPLADEYADNFKQQIDQISATLGNDPQRQAFSAHANELLNQFKSTALQHEMTEYKNYTKSTYEASIDTSLQSMVNNYGTPNLMAKEVDNIKKMSIDLAISNGLAPEYGEVKAKQLISSGHTLAIKQAIVNDNLVGAEAYYNSARKSGQMTVQDDLQIDQLIGKQMAVGQVINGVKTVFDKYAPQLAVDDNTLKNNITFGAESGFRQFDKNGNVLASGKGALGFAQVMPTTAPEAAKLAGVEWRPELFFQGRTGDPVKDKQALEYNQLLGTAYLDAQYKKFGSLDKAWAAYNAGPGALQDAMNKASKPGGSGNYLEYLPKETQAYVTNNMAEFTKRRNSVQPVGLNTILEATADQFKDAPPAIRQMAINKATVDYNTMQSNVVEREATQTASAIDGIIKANGNFAALSADVISAIPYKSLDKLTKFADAVSNGSQKTDLAVFNKLTNSDYLGSLTDAQFNVMRADLDAKDFKIFQDQRASLKTGAAVASAGNIPTGQINQILNNRLQGLGIDPTPTSDDDKIRLGAIKKFMYDAAAVRQAGTGKAMTDVEVTKFVDDLFSQSRSFRKVYMGGLYTSQATPETLITMKAEDIPPSDRDQIVQALQRNGIAKPTDADVLGLYFKAKIKPRQVANNG